MFRNLRQLASKRMFKLLLVPLLAGFAMWGIGDVFGFQGSPVIAEVEEETVTVADFETLYESSVEDLARQTGRFISSREARDIGMPQRALGQLISRAGMDIDTKSLNLDPADDQVLQAIRADPAYRDPLLGDFDARRFRSILARRGISEDDHVEKRRRELSRRQLVASIAAVAPEPNALARTLFLRAQERRAFRRALLDLKDIPAASAPSDTELRAYLKANAQRFRLPETRALEAIALDVTLLAKNITITEDALRAGWNPDANPYREPERRTMTQLIFPSPSDAQAARVRLVAGSSTFAQEAQTLGLSEGEASIGPLPQEEFADTALAEAVFALEEGALSQPIATSFGTALARVDAIDPATRPTLEEVRDRLTRDLALARAADELFAVYNLVEDRRSTGIALKPIAEELGVPLIVADAVRADGVGLPLALADARDQGKLVADLFLSEAGNELDPGALNSGGYYWAQSVSITPARDPTLEETRATLLAAWRDTRARDLARRHAKAITQDINTGTALRAALRKRGLNVFALETKPVTREELAENLSSRAAERAFAVEPNQAAWDDTADGVAILQTIRIVAAAAPNAQDLEPINARLEAETRAATLTAWLADLNAGRKIELNPAPLRTYFEGQ